MTAFFSFTYQRGLFKQRIFASYRSVFEVSSRGIVWQDLRLYLSPAARAPREFVERKVMEDNMSWLKAITGGVIGAEALNLIKGYVEKQGGIDAVVNRFRDAGFHRQVESWVSTGKNEAISAIEVGQAVGVDTLKKLAQSTGVDFNKARDLLAEYLPVAIDKATPEGKLPPPEKDAPKTSSY
jgi:uncharacterized protein YidB (DUF937 family)